MRELSAYADWVIGLSIHTSILDELTFVVIFPERFESRLVGVVIMLPDEVSQVASGLGTVICRELV